jgi:hypothetical protein
MMLPSPPSRDQARSRFGATGSGGMCDTWAVRFEPARTAGIAVGLGDCTHDDCHAVPTRIVEIAGFGLPGERFMGLP